MARISTYEIDTVVTANDKWIGTDFSGGITKNFTPQVLADFYNESGLLGVVNQINFKYYQTFVEKDQLIYNYIYSSTHFLFVN